MPETKSDARRLPRDVDARQRLHQAQRAEAGAVATVYRAEAALAQANAKRDAVIATADADVQRAQNEVGTAHRNLIDVSGIDRAAHLLGMARSALRRSAAPPTT